MNQPQSAFLAVCLSLAVILTSAPCARAAPVIDILVDARELPRRLLHAETSLDLPAGRSSVLYVKWVPGIHAPRGPVENVGGFEVTGPSGERVNWERDGSDPFRFFIDAPVAGRHTVRLTYITNQPSVNSRSIDSFGYPNQGVVNTNTVAVYPEGPAIQEIEVRPRFLLPAGWKHGSALEQKTGEAGARGDTLVFETVTFEDYIDKPLIAGRWLRTIELANTKNAHRYLHVSADEQDQVPDENDSLLGPLRKLCLESEALFGRTHFASYHFLLSLSDEHRLGIEHRNSSLNSDKPDTFSGDKEWIDTGIETLLPHEVAHAWCGKYRLPEGMLRRDFQEAKETGGLWVYEGLDEYLEKVLSARCGYRDPEVTRSALAYGTAVLIHQKGRAWRPLYDTARAAWTLRGGSDYWTWLRRGQDYYNEGVFIWLEIDARLREMTGGEKTLDDFIARFFSNGAPDAFAVPFDRAEIVGILNDLAPFDWAALIAERVDIAPGDKRPEGVERSGWKLAFTDQKTPSIKEVEKAYKYERLYDSVGFAVYESGKIGSIVPGSPADRAGLLKDMIIVGVDGRRFSSDRLLDAIRETPTRGEFELLVDEAETLRNVVVTYDGGLRYYTLERDESGTDWLSEILKSRTE